MFHGISVLEFTLGTIDILAQTGRVGISVRNAKVGASAIGINSIALGLLNKSSRMVKDHAKNIPTEPKGATPWRIPIRLLGKPYTPIVPQHKHACL